MVGQKGNVLLLLTIIGLLIVSLFFIGYYFFFLKNKESLVLNSSQTTQNVTINPPAPVRDFKAKNVVGISDLKFDVNKIKVGQSFYNKMTVASIEPFNSEYSKLSEKNFKITFSGQATLDGEYSIMDGTEMGSGGKYVKFAPDDLSLDLLPRENYAGGFGYAKSFEFSNYEKAIELLLPKGKKGIATVTIDNYTLVSYPSEISNSAALVSVE